MIVVFQISPKALGTNWGYVILIRNGYKKGLSSETPVKAAVERLHTANLNAVAFCIVGGPEDTDETLESTLTYLGDCGFDAVVPSVFLPFPGTPYFTEPEKYGLGPLDPLGDWGFYTGAVCSTRHLTADQIDAWVRRFLAYNQASNSRKDNRYVQ